MRKPRRLTRRELNLVVVAALAFAFSVAMKPGPLVYGPEYDIQIREEPFDESPCKASPDERIPDWAEVPA